MNVMQSLKASVSHKERNFLVESMLSDYNEGHYLAMDSDGEDNRIFK